MVTFQEFVQSRRDCGDTNTAEQLPRSRSVGHVTAQPSLQRMDDLQLRRSSTSSNWAQRGVAPGSITASITAPARWPDLPSYNSTDQHCTPPTVAAGGGHAATQRQFLSANSSRIQLLQEKLLSRNNSRQLARQHTTTTIRSAVASASPSRAVSRAHCLKQLLASRRTEGEAAGPLKLAAGATSSTDSAPGSPRLLARAVMPLSVADALLGRSNSRAHSRSIDVVGCAHAASPGTTESNITHISRAGSSGLFEQTTHQQGLAPAISQQQSQVLSGTPSNLRVASTHCCTSVKEPSQSQPSQEHLAEDQGAPAHDKAVALQSLLQQQQHLRQMMRLQSLKNLQHQSSKLSQASSLRSRSPGALGADPSTASMSQSRPVSPLGGSDQLQRRPSTTSLSRGATVDLDQQLEQQPSRSTADVNHPGEPLAVAGEAAGLSPQGCTAVAAECLSAQEPHSQHHLGSVIVEVAPVLQAIVDPGSSTCSQQAQSQPQRQQQRRHRLARQGSADKTSGANVAQEAASAASEVTSSSGGASSISSETAISSEQNYVTVRAYNATQSQYIAEPVGSGELVDVLSEQPSSTLTDVTTAVEAVKSYSRHNKQPSHRDSSSYRKELSRSKSSSTSSSFKLSSQHRKSKAQSDILGVLDNNTSQDTAGTAAGCGHTDSHVLLVTRQHAQQLQQQNDALVRVLERERQQHKKTRQQVSETQLELKEQCAEWEIAVHVLREDNAALSAKLRKAMAGGDQQEVFDAYDSALASSAAKVVEAQAAAAALAAQLTDTELQLLQLQHVCNNSALGGASHMSEDDDWERSGRLDGAAVAVAVAAAGSRSASASRSPAAPKTTATHVDSNCSRGLRALRQHQKHLEQQVTKQQQELSKLRREQIKLLRFKKQYNAVVGRLQSAASAQEAAVTVAEDAGLRAAAASGAADRLQQQVEQMQQDNQLLRTVEHELKQQLQAMGEQLKQVQQELKVAQTSRIVQVLAGVQSPVCQPAATAAGAVSGHAVFKVPGVSAAGRSSQQLHTQASAARSSLNSQRSINLASNSNPALVAGTGLPARPAVAAVSRAVSSPAVRHNLSLSASEIPTGVNTATRDAEMPNRQLRHSVSAPSRPGNNGSVSREALSLARQVSRSLPAEAHVQQQLTSLITAIAAGIQEREALATQGQVLLGMVVGAS